MQKELQVFTNNEFGEVRVLEIGGQPWWVLADVCKALGLSNPSMIADRLDDDERAKLNLGRQGDTNIITESGLYAVILRSDKPNAKSFRRWITSEVLPSIRKYGGYITGETLERLLSEPELAVKYFSMLRSEREKMEVLAECIEVLAPKARYHDLILQCDTPIPVSVIAQDYAMSAVSFNKLLHSFHVQYRVGNVWLLYKAHADKGYIVSKTYY